MQKSARLRRSWWLVGGALAASSGPALAQNADAVRRLERQLREFDSTYRVSIPQDQPIAERLLVDAGGSLRFGFYAIDDAFSNAHILRQYDGRAYARVELDGAHRFFARLKFQWDDWNSGDSFDNEGDQFRYPILDRAWYQFDLRGLEKARTGVSPDYNFNFKGGKQLVYWGSGLTLSSVMYAGLVDVEFGKLGFSAIGGITSSLDTVDFDGSRPNYDDHTDRVYAGGMFEYRGEEHRPYVFFLAQVDENRPRAASIGGLFPTMFDYNSQYLGLGSKGSLGSSWSYHTEFVKEFGTTLSNSFDPVGGGAIAQTRDDIDAAAGLVGATYLLQDAAQSRADFELVAGSGDKDRIDSSDTFAGNAPNTKDHSFNALGYVHTGVALAPEPANLLSLRAGFSSSPCSGSHGFFEGLRIGIDAFLFAKIDDNAPVSVTTIPGRSFLGGEIDLFADWRITSDVTLNTRYGAFFAGDAMPAGQDSTRQFFYVGVTYAF